MNIIEQLKDHIGEDVRFFYKRGGHVAGRVKEYNDRFVILNNARAIFNGRRYYFIVIDVMFNTIIDVCSLRDEYDER